ncbi:MAG: DegT/DnrJ/EryC1/StrS family aminotransferase [Pseudomonadota bacterium]
MLSQAAIPFFNYPAMFSERRDEYMAAIESCLERGAFIMQQDLVDFENELAAHLGVKHAIGVADGTMALTIALRLANVQPGDEVIVPSHTFVATAAAVHHVGAEPVLCDCGPDHLIDVESAHTMLTAKTKAIMPVQLNGRVADMDAVEAFANEHSLQIVEDSCQAMGAKFRDRYAGTFGVAGSFSFFPAKTLGCFGDGGGLIIDDDDLAAQARIYRDHGRNPETGKVDFFGHNARLDNVQAAVLRIKLKHYNEAVAARRRIAALYQTRLGDVNELVLPPAPDTDPRHYDVFQNYEIEAERRDELRAYLSAQNIGTILQWGGSMIHQFDGLGLRHHAPFAEKLSTRFMMLPLHHLLTDDEVNRVCDTIIAFYQN